MTKVKINVEGSVSEEMKFETDVAKILKGSCAFGTKDMWSIVAMGLVDRHHLTISRKVKPDGEPELMYNYGPEAWQDFCDWKQGKPRAEFIFLTKVKSVWNLFKMEKQA